MKEYFSPFCIGSLEHAEQVAEKMLPPPSVSQKVQYNLGHVIEVMTKKHFS